MTGTMWDSTCKWIANAGKDVDDSKTYGNYKNSESPANVSGYGGRRITGYSDYWKVKKIYDLAGNVWEYTNEKFGSNCVNRGGSNPDDGVVNSLSYRTNFAVTFTAYTIGFRVALYIL